MELTVKLEAFEGPLDLLLHLLDKNKVSIYDIPIVENKPLARMLYYNVDLEQEIPVELYQMTAEVLSYVYNLKNKAV